MPPYATSGSGLLTPNPVLPTVLYPGDEVYLLGTSYASGQPPTPGQIQPPNDSNVVLEAVTVGERSISAALSPRPGGGNAPGLMVQVIASANPGAAEIDIQDAAIDADGAYSTNSSSTAYKITAFTAAAGGQYTAWAEIQPEGARFISLKVVANPNGVKWAAKVVYV